MVFDFGPSLSSYASGLAAPYSGLPKYHFVGGNIDEPTVPAPELAEAVAKVIRREGHAMGKYGMNSGSQGYLPLRSFISDCVKRTAGMQVSTDEILVTSGSLQAMDLVNRALLDAGDIVVLEAGNYAGALTKLDKLGVQYIGVELDEHGMRMDALEKVLADLAAEGRKPKFIYTIPTVQNPTGSVMPVERRLEMLALARAYDIAIFEDDCYADLTFDGVRPPAIYALDEDNRVVYCATFSKTIAPALRVGYIVAPWPLMGRILPLKTDAGTGALEQMALAEYLPAHFEDHVAALRPMLQEKADTMCAALDEHFGASAEYTRPIGGIYMWVTLPENVDTDRLYRAALAKGVEINPGSEWTTDGAANRHRMRLCFGHAPVDQINAGIAVLAQVCFDEFGVPLRGGNAERT